MTKRKPMIGNDGEVRELTAADLKHFKRGRPPLPGSLRKKRVNVMLDPDLVDRLHARGENVSACVNRLLRAELGV